MAAAKILGEKRRGGRRDASGGNVGQIRRLAGEWRRRRRVPAAAKLAAAARRYASKHHGAA